MSKWSETKWRRKKIGRNETKVAVYKRMKRVILTFHKSNRRWEPKKKKSKGKTKWKFANTHRERVDYEAKKNIHKFFLLRLFYREKTKRREQQTNR